MKVNSYTLKNREVYYLKQKFFRKFTDYNSEPPSSDLDSNLLRVENVNGKLHLSLLPEKFVKEENSKVVFINPENANIFFTHDADSCLVVKQGPLNSELGISVLDRKTNCKGLDENEFDEYVSNFACVNTYTKNGMEVMFNLYSDAIDCAEKASKAELPSDANLSDPYNLQLLIQFNYLATQRKQELKQNNNLEQI